MSVEDNEEPLKRGRGRPKGAKNKPKRGRPKGSKAKPKEEQLKKPIAVVPQHKYSSEEEALNSVLDEERFLDAGYNTCTDKIINNEPVDASYYYRGSKNVPVAGAQYEFTADMIEELRKCKDDIVYFAENFFYIISLDRGKEKIKLYEAQKRVLRSFVNERHVVVCSSRQIGKCFCGDTLIKVRDKNTGEVKEIKAKELFDGAVS